jgi:glycosyltransferase involved in cell wall biosynthesis
MNIAHVVESLEVGGAEVLVATLCNLQHRGGHDVAVHCLSQAGPLALQLEQEGIPVHVHAGLSNWGQIKSLSRMFRESRRQVIHCHNVGPTIFGAFAGRLASSKAIISTRHGSISPTGKRLLLSAAAGRLCDFSVAVGEPTRRVLVSEWGAIPGRIVTIRNGASPARVHAESTVRLRKKGFTAIMVARLKPPKDPATLLRAVALASVAVQDLHLWIVGDGVQMPELSGLVSQLGIAGRVEFLGQRDDVGTYLAAADVFVLSSLSEGVPVSLLEAMAASLPFIVTNAGGMPEIAHLSGAGLVVDCANPTDMAGALTQYANQRDSLPKLGRAARECYVQHFKPESWAEAYLTLYRTAMQSPKSATADSAGTHHEPKPHVVDCK